MYKKVCSNLIEGKFSEYFSEYLVERTVDELYGHPEYLGIKTKEVEGLSWDDLHLANVVKSMKYPRPERK